MILYILQCGYGSRLNVCDRLYDCAAGRKAVRKGRDPSRFLLFPVTVKTGNVGSVPHFQSDTSKEILVNTSIRVRCAHRSCWHDVVMLLALFFRFPVDHYAHCFRIAHMEHKNLIVVGNKLQQILEQHLNRVISRSVEGPLISSFLDWLKN